MEPPESAIGLIALDILAQHYDVVWAPPEIIPDRMGHSDGNQQIIVIRQDLRGMICLDTMIHEIVHAISHITGVDISEQQTHTIGMGMAAVLRNNPELLPWIANRLLEEEHRDYQRQTRKQRRHK